MGRLTPRVRLLSPDRSQALGREKAGRLWRPGPSPGSCSYHRTFLCLAFLLLRCIGLLSLPLTAWVPVGFLSQEPLGDGGSSYCCGLACLQWRLIFLLICHLIYRLLEKHSSAGACPLTTQPLLLC